MGGKIKSISLAAIMVLSTLSGIMMAAPAAATQVVTQDTSAPKTKTLALLLEPHMLSPNIHNSAINFDFDFRPVGGGDWTALLRVKAHRAADQVD